MMAVKKINIEPRYDQRFFDEKDRNNSWQVVVSPDDKDDALWVNQDAYFSLGNFDKSTSYKIHHPGNGFYLMVIEGEIEIDGTKLHKRDAIGITETDEINIHVFQHAELLAIEVPMK